MKINFKIYLITIFYLFLISCNSHYDATIELTFWGMGVEGEKINDLIPQFELENPGIKIKTQQIPWTAAHEKLITAFASETLPDVFQLGNTWVPEFQALNAIEPFDDFIKNSEIIKKDKFFDGIWDTNLLDSLVYGIPWYVDTRVLFYRKDILAKAGFSSPPRTWDELYKIAKAIKENQNDKNKYSIFIPTNEWAPFIIFGLQNGSELLKDNNTLSDFSNIKFKEAYSFLMNLFHEDLAPVDRTQVINLYQSFTDEFFAMYITGPWNVTEMRNRLPENLQDEWMTAPLPSPDTEYPGLSLAGGASLAMNSLSKHKEAAWKFIEYLSKKKTQIEFYKIVSSLPSVKAAWEDSLLSSNIYMNAFYKQLERVTPTPKIPEWEQIVFAKIQQYAELTAAKRKSVDEALKLLDEDVNRILEKRRWIMKKQ